MLRPSWDLVPVVRCLAFVELARRNTGNVNNAEADGLVSEEGHPDVILLIRDHGHVVDGIEATVVRGLSVDIHLVVRYELVFGGDDSINTHDGLDLDTVDEHVLSQIAADLVTLEDTKIAVGSVVHEELAGLKMTGSLEHGFLDLNKSLTGHRTGVDEALFACIVWLAHGTKDGIISAKDRVISIDGEHMTLLQTNAAVNPGNSGGGLFDAQARLVGVVNSKSSGSDVEGLGFAIPINEALKVAYDLAEYGYVKGQAYLGVSVRTLDSEMASYYSLPMGPRVESVTEGSCAAKAGIQVGDIITAVNGQPVSSVDEVGAMKNQLNVGDTMTFTIWRGGEIFDVDVVLMDTNDIYGN